MTLQEAIEHCEEKAQGCDECAELNRTCYGFEVDKGFYKKALEFIKIPDDGQIDLFGAGA